MKHSKWIYPFLYAGFTLLALYKSIVGEYGEAAMHLGIALAFDPVDPTVSWKNRPLWQRAWLVIHLALCAAAFGFEMGTNEDFHQGFRDGFNRK